MSSAPMEEVISGLHRIMGRTETIAGCIAGWPAGEDIRPGHDASDFPADPHERGLAVEEQHL